MSYNYSSWPFILTIQSKEILHELEAAKKHTKALLLINDTGMGKTFNQQQFSKAFKQHTYIITVGDSYKLVHIVDEIIDHLKIPKINGVLLINQKLKLISNRLHELKKGGAKPMIILDEAENLKPQSLKMIKELYDAIYEVCSIVMIGTEQIMDAILNRKHKNRQSVPQLWRRFKAGTRYISKLKKSRDFTPFFDKLIKQQKDIQDLLVKMCDNYGELHDYLHPFLIYCNEKQQQPRLDLFIKFHNIPVNKL